MPDSPTLFTDITTLIDGVPNPSDKFIRHAVSLQKKLDYSFSEPRLLYLALSHSSYVNENNGHSHHSYERLEFLGDAVIALALSHYLFTHYTNKTEGELTVTRSWLGSSELLSKIATNLSLGSYAQLGVGEDSSGGRARTTLLEDLIESVIGSIFLDGGFNAAYTVILELFSPHFDEAIRKKDSLMAKNNLQTIIQSRYATVPEYIVIDEEGPDHNKIFTIEVRFREKILGCGTGKTKKEAEMKAAQVALDNITQL
jgi:ribonuclease III